MRNSLVKLERASAIVAAAIFAIALSGCNIGPRYARPAYPAPPTFRGADDVSVVSDAQNSLGDQQWSQVFREPELQALIRTALANNYDIRIAAQRVLEQQAQVQITRSQQFPQITGGGTGMAPPSPIRSDPTFRTRSSSAASTLAPHGRRISGASIANRRRPRARNFWRKPGHNAPFA